jgi:TrkA domain protein
LLLPTPTDSLPTAIEIDLVTEQIPVTARSPYSGRTLGDTQVRSRTGASIVAVLRRSGAVPSPAPDFRFAIGDTLVVVGTREGVDAAADLITGG